MVPEPSGDFKGRRWESTSVNGVCQARTTISSGLDARKEHTGSILGIPAVEKFESPLPWRVETIWVRPDLAKVEKERGMELPTTLWRLRSAKGRGKAREQCKSVKSCGNCGERGKKPNLEHPFPVSLDLIRNPIVCREISRGEKPCPKTMSPLKS